MSASTRLLLGQRVVAIPETGLRTATYKLATLMALIDFCIENLPRHPDDLLAVPIPDLAHRVPEIYWRQVRPFDGSELDQSTQPSARILHAANRLRLTAGGGHSSLSLETASVRAADVYRDASTRSRSAWPSSRCTAFSGYRCGDE